MTTNAQPVSQQEPNAVQNAQAADPAVQTAAGAGAVTGATKISSIGDLREKAPEVYQALLLGIGLKIKADQEASMRRFKEEQRKSRR